MDEINSQHFRRVVVSTGAMAVLRKELEKGEASKESGEDLKKLPPQSTGEIPKDSFSRKHVVAAHVLAQEKCKQAMEKLASEKPVQSSLLVTIGADRVVKEEDEAGAAAEDSAEKCPLETLKEIFLPQLELNKCHRGRVLFGRLCVSPFQISSVMTVMADKSGKAVRVCISGGKSFLSKKEVEARFGMDMKIGIKEPYLKMCSDHVVAIKVDKPSQFVLVDDCNKEISTDLEAAIEGLDKIRADGNALFAQQKWDEAVQQYTDCIDKCNDLYKGPHKEDDKIRLCLLLAYSNRSEVWLQVENFKNALDDANMALEFDASHQKSISRRDRAWQSIGKVQVSTNKGKVLEDEPEEPSVGDAKGGAKGLDGQEVVREVSDGRKSKTSKGASRTSKGFTSIHVGRSVQKKNNAVAARGGGSQAEETNSNNALPTGKPSSRKSWSPAPAERAASSKEALPSKWKGMNSKNWTLLPGRGSSKRKSSRARSTSPVRVQSARSSAPSSAHSSRSGTPTKSVEGTDVTDSDSSESLDSDSFDERERSHRNSMSPAREQFSSNADVIPSKDDHVAASSSFDAVPGETVTDVAQNGSSKVSSALKSESTDMKAAAASKGKQTGSSKRKGASNNAQAGGSQSSISQSKDSPSTGVSRTKSTIPGDDLSRPVSSDGKGRSKPGQSSDVAALGNAGFPAQPLEKATVGMGKPVNTKMDASPARRSSEAGLKVGEETTESRKKNASQQQPKGKNVLADEKVARALLPRGSKAKAASSDARTLPITQSSVDTQKEPIAIVDQEGPLFATWLDSIRSSGDLLLNDGKWADAIAKFNKVMKVTVPKRNQDRVIQTILQAVSHRAEAWIWLGNYENALRDAEYALQFMEKYPRSFPDHEPEYLLNEIRRGRAFYGLQKYEQACTIFAAALQASPYDKSISDLLEKSRACFEQSRKGIYHMDKYFLSACDGPPPPCSDYVGPVEIRSTPGKGRGLFLTADVAAGDLLLVSNPLAVVRRRLNRPSGGGTGDEDDYHLLTSKWRRNVTSFGLDEFIGRLALSQSAQKSYQFHSLAAGGAGDDAEVPDINAFIIGSDFEVPQARTVPTTDVEDLRAIVRWNAIDGGLNPLSSCNPRGQEKEDIGCVGLWALPSFINHSCVPNCHMIDVGNAMFVRASCEMQEGEELTRAYFDVFQNGMYRQRITKEEWDFICDCERCSLEKSLTIQRVLPLQDYRNLLDSVQEESRRRNESEEKDRALSMLLPNPNPAHLKLRKFADNFDRILFTADGLTCKEKAWIGASYLEAYVSRFVGSKDRNQMVLALENILDFMTNTAILGPGEALTTLGRASFLLQEVIRYYGAGSYTHRRIEVRVLGLYAIAYGNLGREVLLTISHTMANSGKAFIGLIDDHLRRESTSSSQYFTQGNIDPGALALQYY